MKELTPSLQAEMEEEFLQIATRYMGDSNLVHHFVGHIKQFWMASPGIAEVRDYFKSAASEYFTTKISQQDAHSMAGELLQVSASRHLCSFEVDWLKTEVQVDLTNLPTLTIRNLYEDVLTFGPEHAYLTGYVEWLKPHAQPKSPIWQQIYDRVNKPENDSLWQLAIHELDTTKYREALTFDEVSRLNRIRIQISRSIVATRPTSSRSDVENRRLFTPAIYSLVGPNIFSEGSYAEAARASDEKFFKQLKEHS